MNLKVLGSPLTGLNQTFKFILSFTKTTHMAKKITKKLKLVAPAGKITPAPPYGPALGQAGINIGEFVKQFNDATAKMIGDMIPVEVSVYEDRTFSFILKTPPASNLILKALGKEKGSGKNAVSKIGTLTKAQLREIAE